VPVSDFRPVFNPGYQPSYLRWRFARLLALFPPEPWRSRKSSASSLRLRQFLYFPVRSAWIASGRSKRGGTTMAKRVSPEAALLMLHWQNSVCDPKGVWGKNLCRQIEKNNAVKNAQSVLATARSRGLLTIFVNIGWRPGFPELPENQYYPLLQGAKDENKGIVGTWEVDVIDALRPMAHEPIVINFGSDSFEGTDLDRILRANAVGHLFVSGQCIEHVVATTIKRAANMGYNATLIKDATSGFTDSNYQAMVDILPLYAKLITSAAFMLEAPYGGTARNETEPNARNSFTGRVAWLRP
jgi:nicotinamidase-related amidase